MNGIKIYFFPEASRSKSFKSTPGQTLKLIAGNLVLTEVMIFELELSIGSVITNETSERFFPSVNTLVPCQESLWREAKIAELAENMTWPSLPSQAILERSEKSL